MPGNINTGTLHRGLKVLTPEISSINSLCDGHRWECHYVSVLLRVN